MNLNKQRNSWIFAGVCFFISALFGFARLPWLGWADTIVSLLFFVNAYKINRDIKSKKSSGKEN